MACIDNLVTVGLCDEPASLSGLTLLMAGGMNAKNFANIATDSSGLDMVLEKKQVALVKLRSKLMAVLSASNVITEVVNPEYETGYFNTSVIIPASANGRGAVIHKNLSFRGSLRKTTIQEVEVYPLDSGTGTLQIFDGKQVHSWAITLVANQVNVYNVEQLEGFPYQVLSNEAKVYVKADGIRFASTVIQCKTGCHGAPNPCGYADGWDGTKKVKHEGYGVNPIFKCECDYDVIMCSNPALFGQLHWLMWQWEIYDEQYKSNRFNHWVTYNQEQINEVIAPQLNQEISKAWQPISQNLFSILKTFRDDCLDCRRVKRVVNV